MLDPEIERIACAIRRVVREATLTQQTLIEDNSLISLDSEDEIIMEDIPSPPTIGDYYKRTDEGHISIGFLPETPANFDINFFMLSGLRDNMFDMNTIRDSWEHLARFYKIASMCRSTDVTEDQVTPKLFGLSLIGRAKDWLLFFQMELFGHGKSWRTNSWRDFLPPLSLLNEELKSQNLSSRKLNHCMTHGKGLTFYYAGFQIIT